MLHTFLHILGHWLAELHNLRFSGSHNLKALHVMAPSLAMAIWANVQTYYSHGEEAPTVVPTFTFLHEAAETLIQSSMGYF
jgi:hypothetical protein